VAFADLARGLMAEGSSVLDELARLHRIHGLWVSHQSSVVHEGIEGARRIADAMARIGDAPPSTIAGARVIDVVDFRSGADSRAPWLSEHDLVAFTLDEGRVMIRPSGTEPKCKVYVDVRADLDPDATLDRIDEVEVRLAGRAADLAADLIASAGL